MKKQLVILLSLTFLLGNCCKPDLANESSEPKTTVINEVFELEYNQNILVADTTRIVNDSFPKYSVYFDWVNDERCFACASCLGGFIYINTHITNLQTKNSVSDTLYYPSCTEAYIEGNTSYGFLPIVLDSVEFKMKRVLPMKPQENKNHIELSELKVSLLMKKRK